MDPLLTDILDQPRALTAALEGARASTALLRARELCRTGRRILLSGMGASYFAAYPAYLHLLAAGAPVAWIEAGELLHQAPAALRDGTVLVLISQSGRSAEVVRLLQARGGAAVIGVTNDLGSPLAAGCDVCLPLSAGPERAGVATKTLTCSLLLMDLLSGDGNGANWPGAIAAVEHALQTSGAWLPGMLAALGTTDHIWVLGRGPLLAAAAVGGLMLKEAGGVHGEGLSAPQFRHGPLEMAGPGRSALLLVSPGRLGALDLDLAGEMADAGMGVAAVCPAGAPAEAPAGVHALRWPDCPPQPGAVIVAAQLLAHACALRQQREPGTFSRIGKVTTRE